jgi:flagellar hook-associated protein 3 FlgL
MRVTPNITAQNSLYNIQNARSRLDTLQEKLASGQNTNRPSDDPITTSLLMNIGDRLSAAEQYTSNIDKVDIWFKVADAAFTSMSTSLTDVRSKVSTIGSGMSTQNDRDNAVSYLEMIKKTLVDLGNTDVNGVYIFAGTNNLKPPFAASTGDTTDGNTTISNVVNVANMTAGMSISGPGIPDNTTIASINNGPPASIVMSAAATSSNAGVGFSVYGGDSNEINVEINKGVSEAINIPGNQFLTPSGAGSRYGSTDILKSIDQLILDLKANNISGIGNGVKALDNGTMQVNSAQIELQSRMVRSNAASQMHQNVSNTLQSVLSNTQTADYAQLGVELQMQQTAFQATLSATAKITQMSLLDYL